MLRLTGRFVAVFRDLVTDGTLTPLLTLLDGGFQAHQHGLKRFEAGEPMTGLVDRARGY